MKVVRIVSVLIFLALMLSVTSCKALPDTLSAEELDFLQQRLKYYGYGDREIQSDVLYSKYGNASYIFAATDRGYVLYRRSSLQFCECGDGNPYEGYMSFKKYFEGPTFYSVELPEGYYSITRQEFVDK